MASAHFGVFERADDELHDVVQHALDAAQVRIRQPTRHCTAAEHEGEQLPELSRSQDSMHVTVRCKHL